MDIFLIVVGVTIVVLLVEGVYNRPRGGTQRAILEELNRIRQLLEEQGGTQKDLLFQAEATRHRLERMSGADMG